MLKRLLARIVVKLLDFHQDEVYAGYRTRYTIHPSFRFNGKNILLYGEGEIICGENSYIGELSTWQASKGVSIRIGKNCCISHNVRCYTQSYVSDSDFSLLPVPCKEASVTIGDNVWIGANVFINPGVTIGDNSIVGANSVVVKDVEPNSIVSGIPAKLLRYKKLG